jgi:hypothetical protein
MNAIGSSDASRWRKSKLSSYNGNCVEVAKLKERHVGVRDSKDRDAGAPVLAFTATAWRTFVQKAKNGHFDI